ncbi:MAG: acyltransferase [Nostocoides sp.]
MTSAPDRSQATAYLPSLDGLRAVAAGLVVLTHAAFLTGFVVNQGLLGRLMGRGDLGVSIFFALSGFLLHRGFVDSSRPLGVRDYFVRRAVRVLPAYWLVVAVVVACTNTSARDAMLHVLGAQIYVADSQIPSFSQSWSVATELSFYVALPLAAVGLNRLRRRSASAPLTILTWTLVSSLALTWFASSGRIGVDILFERWLPARAANFIVGMLLAEVLLAPDHPVERRLRALAAAPGSALVLAGAAYLFATTPAAGLLTLGVVSGLQLAVKMACGSIVALALLAPLVLERDNRWRRAMAHPVCRWLGRISYGTFLWHVPVFFALYDVSGLKPFSGGMLPLLALGIPITLCLAALTYYLFEAPLIRAIRTRHPGQNRSDRHERQDAGQDLDVRGADRSG